VVHGGSTARTFKLGRLGTGTGSVTWDGKLAGGVSAESGAYSIKVTADGALGVTSAAALVSVDLAAPRLTAPLSVRGTARKTMRISYTVKDRFSSAVKVGAEVTNAAGTVIAKLSPGWVKQGAAHTIAWRAAPPRHLHADLPRHRPGRQPDGDTSDDEAQSALTAHTLPWVWRSRRRGPPVAPHGAARADAATARMMEARRRRRLKASQASACSRRQRQCGMGQEAMRAASQTSHR
jgi:hypothetical protein